MDLNENEITRAPAHTHTHVKMLLNRIAGQAIEPKRTHTDKQNERTSKQTNKQQFRYLIPYNTEIDRFTHR